MITVKICTSCTPRYQKPISASKRKCPSCGAKGRYAFRAPTEQEIASETARRAKAEAFLQELLAEPRQHPVDTRSGM